MTKISKTHHITKTGIKKRNPVKSVKRFRVYYELPTNFGFEKSATKFFSDESKAKKYFETLKSRLGPEDEEEDVSVVLEDLKTDVRDYYRYGDE